MINDLNMGMSNIHNLSVGVISFYNIGILIHMNIFL